MTDELNLGTPEGAAPSQIPTELDTKKKVPVPTGIDRLRRIVLLSLPVLTILVIAGVWSLVAFDTSSKNQAEAVVVLDPAPVVERSSSRTTLTELPSNTFAPYSFSAVPDRSSDDGPAIKPLSGRTQIALVIDDLGLNVERTRVVAELGVPLTMSFLPYAPNLTKQLAYARQKEHDVFAHIPMEPENPNADAGENVLKLGMSRECLVQTLENNLAPFDRLVGVNNHMGSRFTSNRDSMVWLLSELRTRGLLFLDSRTTTETQGELMAIASGMAGLRRHVFLDHERPSDPQEVISQLMVLEDEARKRGIAVAIGHPHPATLEALRQWIPEAKSQGLLFVRMRDVAAQYEDQKTDEIADTQDTTDNVALTP